MLITTKYIAETATKPRRIKAWCRSMSVTISEPIGLDGVNAHFQAAKALMKKTGKRTGYTFIAGEKDDGGYVFYSQKLNAQTYKY